MADDNTPRFQPLKLLGALAVAPFVLAYVGVVAAHQAVGRALRRSMGQE